MLFVSILLICLSVLVACATDMYVLHVCEHFCVKLLSLSDLFKK